MTAPSAAGAPAGARLEPPRDASVVVVGAGVAGTAAAFSAASVGASVIVVDGGTGASTLATGALDVAPWPSPPTSPARVAAETRVALNALGGYVITDADATLATTAGVLRTARARDASLLDVAQNAVSRDGLVAVVRFRRAGWDADALAESFGDRFAVLDSVVLRHVGEDVMPDADLAARHDDPERLGWLAERVREALARTSRAWAAVLLPPILGVDRAVAHDLSARVGLPCGEATGLPGGPAGLRFERSRARLLAASRVRTMSGRAQSIDHLTAERGSAWAVALEDGTSLRASAVVLATGGWIGGGLAYAPPEADLATALPPRARRGIRLSVDATPASHALGARGRPLHVPGSLFGAPPEAIAAPFAGDGLMDCVGVLAAPDGSVSPPDGGEAAAGLFVAGEIVADAPRTWLEAFASGLRAGAGAAASAGAKRISARPPWRGEEPASRP